MHEVLVSLCDGEERDSGAILAAASRALQKNGVKPHALCGVGKLRVRRSDFSKSTALKQRPMSARVSFLAKTQSEIHLVLLIFWITTLRS